MAKYLMGIDAGTGSVRVAIFDLKGRNRAYDVQEYPTTYPQNGWAEQDDEKWLVALGEAIPNAISKAQVDPEDIVAITCDATTNTLVYLGEDDRSVRKPILWMDVRAAGEAAGLFFAESRHQQAGGAGGLFGHETEGEHEGERNALDIRYGGAENGLLAQSATGENSVPGNGLWDDEA